MRPVRTAAEWALLAIRFQERANTAERIWGCGSRPMFRRIRARDAAAERATALGVNPWGWISEAATLDRKAAFHHLFAGGIQ